MSLLSPTLAVGTLILLSLWAPALELVFNRINRAGSHRITWGRHFLAFGHGILTPAKNLWWWWSSDALSKDVNIDICQFLTRFVSEQLISSHFISSARHIKQQADWWWTHTYSVFIWKLDFQYYLKLDEKKLKWAIIFGDLCRPVCNRKTGVFASKVVSTGSQMPDKNSPIVVI